jgi:alkylation response protein AidB-like acyl-CoA dehydrogenase
MSEYYADLRDLRFVLFEQNNFSAMKALPRFAEVDEATVEAILDEAYKFARNQLAPMNATGDREGPHFDAATGRVEVPKAFVEAYKLFCEGGWVGLHHSPEWGGQGMPVSVFLAASELFFGSCLAFSLTMILNGGVAHLIEAFGSDELKKLFTRKVYSGQWSGTMCLTEAQAGSDVGASRAKAVRKGDRYLISGEKIFITAGEHNLTENIVHAVLARVEGAPAGTKGLSLFIVPKIWINPDGSLGKSNDVKCTSIEHKMGIHASPTCTIVFGGEGKCEGYLLGAENRGMAEMFQMMNEARIMVGLQGSALANAAYQFALRYARERLQSRHILRARDESAPPTTIINHPDVRYMLLWQKAMAEGLRALLMRSMYYLDLAEASTEKAEREKYLGLVELLTPVCKGFASDQGFRVTELALQTLGGYGYISEYPIEQYLRDAKIASIYEGTNGIQALDLVGRKLPAKGGLSFTTLVGLINDFVDEHRHDPGLQDAFAALGEARDALSGVAMYFGQVTSRDPLVAVLNATPFLDLFGHVLVGWLLLEQATIAYPKLKKICEKKDVDIENATALTNLSEADGEASYLDGKIKSAIFFARRALPLCRAKGQIIKSGDRTALEANL